MNKYIKKMVQHRAYKYKRDLMIVINEDCKEHGSSCLTTTTMTTILATETTHHPQKKKSR